MTLPAVLFDRATRLGEVAGVRHAADRPFKRCPWILEDTSITRRRQAAAWWQAFERTDGITDRYPPTSAAPVGDTPATGD